MKKIQMQHEITAELERRTGLHGLKLIRLKGGDPSWEVGALIVPPLDSEAAAKLRESVTAMQNEIDMA